MANVDGNLPEDSGSILTSQNLHQYQEGKVDPGDLIRAVLAVKSAFYMLKSAIKADGQHAQITKANQGPSAQTRATKACQPLDPEISIIDPNPPKKSRWDVSNPSTSGSGNCNTDHEDAIDTEAAASEMFPTGLSAVLNKINNYGSLASLGKEDYPINAGRKLFGAGFEARLKARAETAKTLMDAGSAGRRV